MAWALRVLVVLGLLGSAWVHYHLWSREGFADIPTVGPLFLVNAVAGVVIAVAVLLWRHWLPVLAAIGFGAATLGAYLVSLTPNGLLGVHEEFRTAAEVWGVVTEAGCVVFGLALLAVQRRAGARRT
ncbi:hypothetical protein FNH05_31800 [Amycolatopsis rhizosphaerae]|uniref:DUF4383 domain-containing protein n=1 Tax=Amycolatopsis rhizosphaerae TaxID=2053003 RepID=A0A558APJ0_9PSEU|nr:hypothetical protein [Amycolatopsis rhizosphaerae]TVT26175.1 hypothetical protein FNH05_31800 [Amycolatopsis rhizosphaerae]